jgi:hypothetical protein
MPNKALQPTAATVTDLPGREVTAVAAAAELGRSARGCLHEDPGCNCHGRIL